MLRSRLPLPPQTFFVRYTQPSWVVILLGSFPARPCGRPRHSWPPTRAPRRPPALLRWAFGCGQLPGGARVGRRWRARPRALFFLSVSPGVRVGMLLRGAAQIGRTVERAERRRFDPWREISRAGRMSERHERRRREPPPALHSRPAQNRGPGRSVHAPPALYCSPHPPRSRPDRPYAGRPGRERVSRPGPAGPARR